MSKDHVTWDNDWLRRIKVFNHLISLMYHCSAWWLTKAKMSILWSALMLIWGDGHFTNIVHKLKGIEIDSAYNSLFLIDSKEVVSVTGNLFLFYITRKKKAKVSHICKHTFALFPSSIFALILTNLVSKYLFTFSHPDRLSFSDPTDNLNLILDLSSNRLYFNILLWLMNSSTTRWWWCWWRWWR